jgi:DNA-binding MarR family transcriptional regulator
MTPNLAAIRRLREAIRVLEREITGQLRSETAGCGVSLAQCHTLMELDSAEPISLTDLAQRFALDPSTLSRTVDGMVKSGLLVRIANPVDRRSVRIGLTPKGEKAAAGIHRRCDEFYSSMLEGLPAAKQSALLEGIAVLAEGIRDQRSRSRGSACCLKASKAKRKMIKPKG